MSPGVEFQLTNGPGYANQQLEIAEVPAGTDDLEILYLSDSSTVLGTYRQPAVSVAVGEGATGSAVTGDFNHDGATDLAVMNTLGNAITVPLAR